jgi:hypothetical protein
MKRLPHYDSSTSRSEFAAYLGLGLVATMATVFAVQNALKFANSREDIIIALSAPIPASAIVASNNSHRMFTNVTHIEGITPKEGRNGTGPRS